MVIVVRSWNSIQWWSCHYQPDLGKEMKIEVDWFGRSDGVAAVDDDGDGGF